MDYERMDDETRPRDATQTTRQPSSPPDREQERWVSDVDHDEAINRDTLPANPMQIELPFMPRNQLAAVRLAMGLLLTVLVVAALATVVSVQNYRLVVATFWAFVLVAFVGLAQLLQSALERDQDILPPVVRRVVEAVATEVEHFRRDWREQVLLLKNVPEETGYATAATGETPVNEPCPDGQTRKKARSRLFRAVVQPWVPLLSRRRRRRQTET